MENSPGRLILFVAHGSGLVGEDRRWREELLSVLRHHDAENRFEMAFVKGCPSLDDVLETCGPGEIVILPLCLSEGFFCRKIIPEAVARSIEGKEMTVTYLPSLASRPKRLLHLLAMQASSLVHEGSRGKTHLLLVSHGSEWNDRSDELFHELEGAIPGFRSYSHAYLKLPPSLEDVVREMPEGDVLVLPYFLSRGHHTLDDIPASFGMAGSVFGTSQAGGRLIHYAEPLGMHPAVADIIGDIVEGVSEEG